MNLLCALAFADDIVLLAESPQELQLLLNLTAQWCKKWRVVVNAEKTSAVHFRPKNFAETDFVFKLNENEITKVQEYRYLGVSLDCFGSTDIIENQLSSAGSRALGAMIGKTKNCEDLGYASFTKLFMSCVTPVLDYCCGAWNVGTDHSKIDAVQMRASRYLSGMPQTAANLSVIGDVCWRPGVVRRDLESLRLYNQIVKMEKERLTYRVLMYDRIERGAWSVNLQSICDCIAQRDAWNSLTPVNLDAAKVRLEEMYHQTWRSELRNKTKLNNYSVLADGSQPANHLTANLSKIKRSLISRLRSGSLQLEVERGRFSSVPRDERICKLCGVEVEDELHFLFKCEIYRETRKRLYRKVPELANCDNLLQMFKTLCNMPY